MPRSVTSANPTPRANPDILLPDTPEWDIQNSLDEVNRELGRFQGRMQEGDPAAASRAIDRAERLLPQAPAAAAAAPLRAAIAQLRQEMRPNPDGAIAHVSNIQRAPAQRTSLRSAVRSFQRTGNGRALVRHFGGTRMALRRLATTESADLKNELTDAGATPEEAHAMLDRLTNTLGPLFHRSVASQARSQLGDAARRFDRLAHGQGLQDVAGSVANGSAEGQALLQQMRGAGVDMNDIDRVLAEGGDAAALATAMSPALTTLASKVRDLRSEIMGSDLAGPLYLNMPGAARVAAERLGLDPSVVEGHSDGTVVGTAVAHHSDQAREAREGAETWLTHTLAIASLPFGAAAVAAVGVRAGVEIATAAQTIERGENANLAATAGLETAEGAEQATAAADRAPATAAANIGVAAAAAGAAFGVGHLAGKPIERAAGETVSHVSQHIIEFTLDELLHFGGHAAVRQGEHSASQEAETGGH